MWRIILILALILPIFWPNQGFAYDKWEWNGAADNYHVNDPQFSANGQYLSILAGTDTMATDELLFFKTKKDSPQWRFNYNGALWDNDISKKGRYVVACGSKVWLFDNNKKTNKKDKNKKAKAKMSWKNDFGSEVFDTCAITPNGKYIVAGSRWRNVYLFKKNSREPIASWKATSSAADGINDVAISDDGRYVVASTDTSVLMMDRVKDKKLWEHKNLKKDVLAVDITEDGEYALANQSEKVFLYKKNKKKPIKKKVFDSFHPLESEISKDGKYIYVTTNDKYYAYQRKNAFKTTKWEVNLDETHTDLNISNDGKYIAVSSGYDYSFIFDRDYPETENRPFQYYTGVFVGAVGLDGQGKKFAYESSELRYRDVEPGVLADLQDDTTAYGAGSEMNLRLFMTNPGKATNAKVKVDMKLPQLGWWEDFGGDYEGEPDGIVSKALAKVGNTIGATTTLHTDTYKLKKHKSKVKELELEMPTLQDSGFWSGLLDTLGISDLIESVFDALDNILPDAITDAMRVTVNKAVSGNPLTYPMLGFGEVKLYDSDTGEVYSRDSFTFIYLL